MSAMSPSGVYYDLRKSPFKCLRNGFEFYFSSVKHLEKFRENCRMKEEWLSDSLTRRFHVPIRADELADIQLYLQTEKRGFRIVRNGVTIKCPEELCLVFHGTLINKQGLENQSESTMLL